jgi:hypothetical protein
LKIKNAAFNQRSVYFSSTLEGFLTAAAVGAAVAAAVAGHSEAPILNFQLGGRADTKDGHGELQVFAGHGVV